MHNGSVEYVLDAFQIPVYSQSLIPSQGCRGLVRDNNMAVQSLERPEAQGNRSGVRHSVILRAQQTAAGCEASRHGTFLAASSAWAFSIQEL